MEKHKRESKGEDKDGSEEFERIPFRLRVFDLRHMYLGRLSPKLEPFSRRFATKPADLECTVVVL